LTNSTLAILLFDLSREWPCQKAWNDWKMAAGFFLEPESFGQIRFVGFVVFVLGLEGAFVGWWRRRSPPANSAKTTTTITHSASHSAYFSSQSWL